MTATAVGAAYVHLAARPPRLPQRPSVIAEAGRELRAFGFRTRVTQTPGGLFFTASRAVPNGRILLLASPDGTSIVAVQNDRTGRGRVKLTADLPSAAAYGMQYAELVTR